MESVNKVASLAARVANSDTAASAGLAAAFAVLMARSVSQQRDIEALEAEKASLVETNKRMKSSMWSWKQSLFADAADPDSPQLVPLSRLKAIYGDAPASKNGDALKEGDDSPASKLVV